MAGAGVTVTATRATLPVLRALLDQARRKNYPSGVLGVRARPEWPGPPEFTHADVPVRVVPCVSALAVREALLERVRGQWLVVLTDRPDDDLGAGVLSHLVWHRLRTPDPWDAVRLRFAATGVDPALTAAAEDRDIAIGLLTAVPADGLAAGPGRRADPRPCARRGGRRPSRPDRSGHRCHQRAGLDGGPGGRHQGRGPAGAGRRRAGRHRPGLGGRTGRGGRAAAAAPAAGRRSPRRRTARAGRRAGSPRPSDSARRGRAGDAAGARGADPARTPARRRRPGQRGAAVLGRGGVGGPGRDAPGSGQPRQRRVAARPRRRTARRQPRRRPGRRL